MLAHETAENKCVTMISVYPIFFYHFFQKFIARKMICKNMFLWESCGIFTDRYHNNFIILDYNYEFCCHILKILKWFTLLL